MSQIRKIRGKNTKNFGLIEFLVYKDKTKYIGVCLTLNIVEEGKDPQKLMASLKEAAIGHILLVARKKLDNNLLNRPAQKKYWNIYFKILKILQSRRPIVSPYQPIISQLPMSSVRV